jgi:endonuclease III-like uncharacterized protein
MSPSYESGAGQEDSDTGAILREVYRRLYQKYGPQGWWPGDGPQIKSLRGELLSIYGVGPETADDILVYAAGKPSFVIDVYTRRILQRMGLSQGINVNDYLAFQAIFHRALPQDAGRFNEYHALLDQHARQTCARVPRCGRCCLQDLCLIGRQSRQSPGGSRGIAST